MQDRVERALPMDVEALQSKGFVSIPYPRKLRASVQDALESWKNFCSLPYEEKSKLSGGDRIKDFGYMRRNDTGPRADDKEQFHALRANYSLLLPIAKGIGERRATLFIDAVDALISEMSPTVRLFAQSVEERYKLRGFENDVMASEDNWVFRYINYPPGSRPIFAAAHVDKAFTFHLAETEEGGEYLDSNKQWQSWPISNEQTMIFPGMTLQHRSQGELKALCHRVVPNERTVHSGRISMVAFIDFKHSHKVDSSRYRMQDFEAGFNYDRPFKEFEKMFVPG